VGRLPAIGQKALAVWPDLATLILHLLRWALSQWGVDAMHG